MILNLLRELVPSPALEIIRLLKQSPGMTVNELKGALKMSYMGVKQHCDALVKKGCLDTWRHPVPHGRPEKI
ncbi:MAG TPA: transcriptional regulator, partial [Verrucomicrobiales bacterium]|nr:transcriptional regulator [Verrucomicrobiales bacterium]